MRDAVWMLLSAVGFTRPEPEEAPPRVISSYSECDEYYEVYDIPVCILPSGERGIVQPPSAQPRDERVPLEDLEADAAHPLGASAPTRAEDATRHAP